MSLPNSTSDRKVRVSTKLCVSGLLLLLLPAIALADGGAPLLLFAGPAVFLVGQVWIVLAESVVLRWAVRSVRWRDAFGDVVVANLKSLLLVGALLPLCVSVGGWLLGLGFSLAFHLGGMEQASRAMATWSLVLTGWVFNSEWVRRLFPFQFVLWFVVSYVLSTLVEGRVLKGRWTKRGEPVAAVWRASWMMNAASYAGLAAALGVLAVRYGHW